MHRPSRVHHIQIKSHKLSIMLEGLTPSTKVATLKADVLSALTSDVATDALDAQAAYPPEIDVKSLDDFELSRAVKERGRPTGNYQVLEPSQTLKDCQALGWDTFFIQFKDRETGELKPVTVTLPTLEDEAEEESR